jgi:hypothetical protein
MKYLMVSTLLHGGDAEKVPARKGDPGVSKGA